MLLRNLGPAALALSSLLGLPASAQQAPTPIERVKLTDGNLTCQQMLDEAGEMDKVVTETQALQASGQNKATAGQAAGVAAEVASRSGFFGAIGGLGGHIFGSVASKAAATTVEQQGATDAVQAAERQKQALARKEHLTQLYLNRNCGTNEAGKTSAAQPPAPATNSPSPTTPAPVFGQPQLNVVNGEPLSKVRRVAVASFTVQFVEAQVGEVTQLHNLGSNGVTTLYQASSRTVGVDFGQALARERMQETTNALYQEFLKELQTAGLEVVAPEKLLASENYKKFAARGATTPRVEDAEAEKSSGQGAIRSVFMSPPGLPLVIKGGSGGESIDYLNTGSSAFSPAVPDHTLTFAGRLSLYSTSFVWNEKDVQKEFGAATLHVRTFVPLAVIEVDQGRNRDWTKAKIEPGVLLGNRFTRMTVGIDGSYSYVFLGSDFKVPGVIEYRVEESPHPNAMRAMLGEKVRTFPSTLHVDRYWRDVPEASRVVYKSFVKALGPAGGA